MKKNSLLLFLLLTGWYQFNLNAQSLSPSVIASTGGFSSNSNYSVSYTVGEMTMVQTFSASGNILTQGFQQPNDVATALLEISGNSTGDFAVYPNPAVDQMWFAFEYTSPGNVSVSITNLLGQNVGEVYKGYYESGKISQLAQLSALASGPYFLTAAFTDQASGTTSRITRKFEIIR